MKEKRRKKGSERKKREGRKDAIRCGIFLRVNRSVKPLSFSLQMCTTHLAIINDDSHVRILYHETDESSARSILKEGFRCGSDGMFGGGIYFASSAEVAKSKARRTGATLVCRVKTGCSLVLCKPTRMTKEGLEKCQCQSVYAPAGHAVSREEWYVYDPCRITIEKCVLASPYSSGLPLQVGNYTAQVSGPALMPAAGLAIAIGAHAYIPPFLFGFPGAAYAPVHGLSLGVLCKIVSEERKVLRETDIAID